MDLEALRSWRDNDSHAHDTKAFALHLGRLRSTRDALLRDIEEETNRLHALARNAQTQLEYLESLKESLRVAIERYSGSK